MSLFGNHGNRNCDTYEFFTQGKVLQGPQKDPFKILEHLFQGLGIKDSKPIVKKFREFYKKHYDKSPGRLIQIFVNPKVIEELTYLALVGGEPVFIKESHRYSQKTGRRKGKVIETKDRSYFKKPGKEKVYDQVVQGKSHISVDMAINKARAEPHKIDQASFNSMQGRLILSPEIMNNPAYIKIYNYFSDGKERKDLPQKIFNKLYDILKGIHPSEFKIFTHHGYPLQRLSNYVIKGHPTNKNPQILNFLTLIVQEKFNEKLLDIIQNDWDFLEQKAIDPIDLKFKKFADFTSCSALTLKVLKSIAPENRKNFAQFIETSFVEFERRYILEALINEVNPERYEEFIRFTAKLDLPSTSVHTLGLLYKEIKDQNFFEAPLPDLVDYLKKAFALKSIGGNECKAFISVIKKNLNTEEDFNVFINFYKTIRADYKGEINLRNVSIIVENLLTIKKTYWTEVAREMQSLQAQGASIINAIYTLTDSLNYRTKWKK